MNLSELDGYRTLVINRIGVIKIYVVRSISARVISFLSRLLDLISI